MLIPQGGEISADPTSLENNALNLPAFTEQRPQEDCLGTKGDSRALNSGDPVLDSRPLVMGKVFPVQMA